MASVLLAGAFVMPVASAGERAPISNRVTKDGIAVELHVRAADGSRDGDGSIRAEHDAIVEFRISAETSGARQSGLRPAAWISSRRGDDGEEDCTSKIRGFIQGSLARRPEIDLNSWFVLALNATGSVTVIDPLLQYGGQKIVTLVPLDAPGADWTLGPDRRSLFVAVPEARHVAAIDTVRWKVSSKIDVGGQPRRIVRQPDGRFLWVIVDDRRAGAIVVIDPDTRHLVKRISTGTPAAEIAFTNDDRLAFVAEPSAGAVTAIDIGTLAAIGQLRTGPRPVALAHSPLARSLLVADEADGSVTVVDTDTLRIAARVAAAPGLSAIALSPDGRWALAASATADRVFAIDMSSNRLRHVLEVGRRPDQIASTPTHAYVRNAGADSVSLIAWRELGKDAAIAIKSITGGRNAFTSGATSRSRETIVPTPEPNAVLIGNPSDATIYYYAEGMNAPMGSFNNMRREMIAVLAVDRSLGESPAGRYSSAVRFPSGGTYDVAFLLNQPRIAHCFRIEVAGEAPGTTLRKPERLQFLTERRSVRLGEAAEIQFRLRHRETGDVVADAGDVRILAVQLAGNWQLRASAASLGDGVYGASIRMPSAGAYRVYVESRSLGLRVGDLPYLVLHASEAVAQDDGAKRAVP